MSWKGAPFWQEVPLNLGRVHFAVVEAELADFAVARAAFVAREFAVVNSRARWRR